MGTTTTTRRRTGTIFVRPYGDDGPHYHPGSGGVFWSYRFAMGRTGVVSTKIFVSPIYEYHDRFYGVFFRSSEIWLRTIGHHQGGVTWAGTGCNDGNSNCLFYFY